MSAEASENTVGTKDHALRVLKQWLCDKGYTADIRVSVYYGIWTTPDDRRYHAFDIAEPNGVFRVYVEGGTVECTGGSFMGSST